MSPEGLAHAMQSYIDALKHQAAVAQSFFFGRLEEAFAQFELLPIDIQQRIDQLLWEASCGMGIDITTKEGQAIMAAAIMRSYEERMGMHD